VEKERFAMKKLDAVMPRFEPMQPWANRILWVDLSDGTARAEPSSPYLPAYLGSRGLAARLCWEHYPEPVPPFDPANPLMVVPGALTGSHAPYAGRTTVHAFSPQAWPYEWFTRSSIGGHFGGELKRAGYDALIVTGSADTPVRLRIVDDRVEVLPAGDLWGQDIYDTLEALDAAERRGAYHLTIGPAGEHLSRIATIHTASSSAAGQGGFGAVMGSKKLKAISVQGTRLVSLAQPERVRALSRALAAVGQPGPRFWGTDLEALNQRLAAEGGGRVRLEACTEGCVMPCCTYFEDVPGVAHDRTWSGAWSCIATFAQGVPPASWIRKWIDWQLSFRAAFEVNVLFNRYGLNLFEVVTMAPWLAACQRAGLISELNGMPMEWDSPQFWAAFLHAVAYREGLGDALAEGTWGAARKLGMGEEIAAEFGGGWGQSGHWDGHYAGPGLPFPYWLVSALQWMCDSRDPFDSGHGYTSASGARYRLFGDQTEAEREALLSQQRALGQRVYGDAAALDPFSGYRGKAYPAYWHTVRAVLLDALPVDDFAFPLIRDDAAPDGYRILHDVEGDGDIEGPLMEHRLFTAGTGLDWPAEAFDQAGERICTLERALQVRHWGRDRALDETLLPYFERTEWNVNPLLGEAYGLDRAQFAPVLTEFYALHGWDANGRPTRERMVALGMDGMYEEMMAGANGR
jgi:aldehyde:ferredoxin oxidoreductase